MLGQLIAVAMNWVRVVRPVLVLLVLLVLVLLLLHHCRRPPIRYYECPPGGDPNGCTVPHAVVVHHGQAGDLDPSRTSAPK